YSELAFAGYWAWDPVEHASLLPWLTATALLHSAMAQQHRGLFKKWNAALAMLTFQLCIVGTYITRSGVVQSVHSFGDSLVGTFFFAFLVVSSIGMVAVLAWRWRLLRGERPVASMISREGAFLATNILLVAMTLLVLIGTVFPVISRNFLS